MLQLKKHHVIGTSAAIFLIIIVLTSGILGAIFYHQYHVGSESFSCQIFDYHCVESHMKGDGINFKNTVTYLAFHTLHPDIKKDVPFWHHTEKNTVVVLAKPCILDMIFLPNASPAAALGNSTCPLGRIASGAAFGGMIDIGIINQTNGATVKINGSDSVGHSKIGGDRVSGNHGLIFTANQGAPVACTVAGVTYNSVTCTSNSIAISTVGAGGTNIMGAALINGTTTNAMMFAIQAFSGVTLVNGDSIIITWTVSD